MNQEQSDIKPIIITVDDDDLNNDFVKEVLSGKYQVFCASSGYECLEITKTTQADIILLDIMMPGLSGLEVCQQLKSQDHTKDIPVLFLTAKNSGNELAKGIEVGAVDYLKKPFNVTELKARVASALRTRESQKELQQYKSQLETLVKERTKELEQTNFRLAEEIKNHQKAETERKKLESQLRQSQKMEALGTLAGGIAHDFNNIIFAINSYIELTLDKLKKKSKEHDNLKKALQASNRAQELVKQIIAFSRDSGQTLDPINIYSIINESLQMIQATLPSSVIISTNIEKIQQNILANPVQIQQIFLNLCTNANYAFPTKIGTIKIGLHEVTVSPQLAKELSIQSGSAIKLSVKDTGCGIPPNIKERIFDPFFTTKPVGSGSGMGLSVVHGIVTGSNGAIQCHSVVGEGTTFEIFFPVTQKIPKEFKLVSNELSDLYGNEHILFVDDESFNLEIVKEHLEFYGYKVTTTNDSRTAFDWFTQKPEQFDLLLTDQVMPHLTGSELAQKMLLLRPSFPVVAMSGYAEKSPKNKKTYPFTDYLSKPITRVELARCIRKIITTQNK